MADQQGTLQTIGSILATALQPLITAFSSTEAFKGFMLRLGWSPSDLPPAYSNLANLVSAVVDKVENLGDNPSPSDIADLVQKGVAAFGAIQSISTAPPGVDAGAFLAEIGERLFEILLTDFLTAEMPAAYNALFALNVITLDKQPATATRPAYVRVKFDWSALPRIISNPGSLPQQVFGWGTPDLDTQKVLDYIAPLFFALKFPVALRPSDDETVLGYSDPTTVPVLPSSKTLDVYFYSIAIAGQELDAGFRLRPLPASGALLPGFALFAPPRPSSLPRRAPPRSRWRKRPSLRLGPPEGDACLGAPLPACSVAGFLAQQRRLPTAVPRRKSAPRRARSQAGRTFILSRQRRGCAAMRKGRAAGSAKIFLGLGDVLA